MRRIPAVLSIAALLPASLALSLPGADVEGPTPAPTTAQLLATPVGEAAQIAQEHLEAETGVRAGDLLVTDEYVSEHNAVTHVYLRQTLEGDEVLGADATVNVQDGQVVFAQHRLVPDVAEEASGVDVLGAARAVLRAARELGVDPTTLDGEPGLAWQVTEDDRVRRAWSFQLRTERDWWNVSVDAMTGELLYRANWVDHEDMAEVAARTVRPEAEGAIEALLDVATVLPPEQFEDGSTYNVFAMPVESPIDGERSIVENPADALASPFGWHDVDGEPGADTTTTIGNNVDAYADTVQVGVGIGVNGAPQHNEADPLSQPDGGEELAFDFAIPTYQATPAVYRDAAVTNLFYWNNVMHDVTYRYGFDEAAGNFQTINHTGLGVEGDEVKAEAQDGNFVLNANFATPPDGGSGRMQMFLWVDAFRDLGGDVARVHSEEVRDGDLDSGVIAHEYGHGISNRLVGGPATVDCLRTHDERQGEGWSDFWSYALTMREGDRGEDPRGIGNYVVYYDDEGARTGPGIRITPYSTDLRVNPSTYDVVRTAAEPHGVGYVWATMLYDMYWNLTDAYGFNPNHYEAWDTGGNNLAVQLVVDGMKFVGCEPGFADARDAILAADEALARADEDYAGSACLIWDAFARRGLGVDAEQGDPASKVDGRNGFAVPSECEA